MPLTTSQTSAMEYVDKLVSNQAEANSKIQSLLQEASLAPSVFHCIDSDAKQHAHVELNFHPDRKIASGSTVAEQLLSDGIYRNQFETRISNGSRSAHRGGIRYEWEKQMFGRAYDEATDTERPKYGALNVLNFSDGSAPRFGSCYLCLRPSVSKRSTFGYGDSVTNPTQFGTIRNFSRIWSAMLFDAHSLGSSLGIDTTVSKLLQRIDDTFRARDSSRFTKSPGRVLDDYIEAQVHGDVRLDRDVDRMVVDPSFENTDTGNLLNRIAETYQIDLQYHNGFVVAVDEIPDDFRGPAIPQLAKRIATGPTINAKKLGEAASSLHDFPEKWQDGGSAADTLQHIKQLWHVLVQFGEPFVEPEFR